MSFGYPRRAGGHAGGRDHVVRPYAVTAGRTRPSGSVIDVVALVSAVRSPGRAGLPGDDLSELGPEHLRLLRFCRSRPSVADTAAELDLPLGVVRILLADLRERGLVNIDPPAATGLHDIRILKEVADALRRL